MYKSDNESDCGSDYEQEHSDFYDNLYQPNVHGGNIDSQYKSMGFGSSVAATYELDFPQWPVPRKGVVGDGDPNEDEMNDGEDRGARGAADTLVHEGVGGHVLSSVNLAAEAPIELAEQATHLSIDPSKLKQQQQRPKVSVDKTMGYPIFVPLVPTFLMPCNFPVKGKSVYEIARTVADCFRATGVSFEFQPNHAEFNAVLVRGSAYTKFQVHVYVTDPRGNDLGNENYDKVVEAQRFGGDGFAFNAVIGNMRSALLGLPSEPEEEDLPKVSDELTAPLTQEEQQTYLAHIRRMVQVTATIESQLEGCRMLCDMVVSNPNFHTQLITFGAVEMLVRLALSTDFLTRQQALVALNAFSGSTVAFGTEAGVTVGDRVIQLTWDAVHSAEGCAGFVDLLCAQVTDGPYYSEAMRRKGAQLLVSMLDQQLQEKEKAVCASASAAGGASSLTNIEKVRRHLAVVREKVVTPRGAKGDSASFFPPSIPAEASSSTSSTSSTGSVRGAAKHPSYLGPGEPLQDEELERCSVAIASFMERF